MFKAVKFGMVHTGLEEVEAWADKGHRSVLKHVIKRWFIDNWN